VPVPVPAAGTGEVLIRNHWLSLDPYMRGRMSTTKSYADPHPLDAVMLGGTVGVVAASGHEGFAVGDTVLAFGGWQEYALVAGEALRMVHRIDPNLAPLQRYLGALGMPGMTAWYGLNRIIEPKAVRLSWSARPRVRLARWWGSWPSQRAVASLASPAAPRSAPM
jgi:NADPH-dependent curcumin reductase CurA